MNNAFHPSASRRREAGFTLIEVMITVAIIGILTAIALPSYKNYVIRGKLVPQTNALASMHALMEQYYQDNRTYLSNVSVTPNILSPCDDTNIAKTYDALYTLSCTQKSATAYTIQSAALTTAPTAGATYTMDSTQSDGHPTTTGLPTSWGSLPTLNHCWIMRKGESCPT